MYLAQFHWPRLSRLASVILKPKPAPLSNAYVLNVSQKSDLGEGSLLYKLQNSNSFFTDTDIAAEGMDHMAAGIDTVGDALCFLIHELSKPENTHVQDRLTAELRSKETNDRDDTPYLDAVMQEGLRCFPPIPMSQPRYVPREGRTIDGYFIPGGTIVSCQAWSVQRLDGCVDDDNFMPERWLEEGAKATLDRIFFAFGAGGRGCTGKQ